MQIQIITENKIKQKEYLAAIKEYQKRLTPFTKIKVITLEEYIPDKRELVIEIRSFGETVSSEHFADSLKEHMLQGISAITFSLLPVPEAGKTMCISHLHMPEPLLVCVLHEQIYRSFMIIHHRTYHK